MPCSDSSSSIAFTINNRDKFISFEYAKITCGQEIAKGSSLSDYLKGKTLEKILNIPFEKICKDLKKTEEEEQFVLHLEWDSLRSAIVCYLGTEEYEEIDHNRCQITSIQQKEKETEIALVILPPKELPKILPCSLSKQR
jgi:hypothetical protein